MVVTCEILLTNNTKGAYRAGQPVQGLLRYVIDKPTEFSSITLSLRGKGLCWWVPLISYMDMCTGSEEVIHQRSDLLHTQENGTATLAAGTYDQSFHFVLPEVLPSTYKDSACFIAYIIELKFVKPNFMSFSKRFEIDVKVKGIKPSLEQPVVYEAKKEFFPSKKSVTLKTEREKMILYAGEDIKLKYYIDDNQSDVNVTSTKIDLVEYINYKSDCKREKKKSKTIKGVECKTFDIKSPEHNKMTSGSLSTTPKTFSIYSKIFTREYRVRITAKFGFPYKDLCLEVPVVIAEKIDEPAEAQLSDQPPSYWQAMNEKEEKNEWKS